MTHDTRDGADDNLLQKPSGLMYKITNQLSTFGALCVNLVLLLSADERRNRFCGAPSEVIKIRKHVERRGRALRKEKEDLTVVVTLLLYLPQHTQRIKT